MFSCEVRATSTYKKGKVITITGRGGPYMFPVGYERHLHVTE
jgi:hypothetical protein